MSRLRTLLERRNGVLLMGILNRTPDSFSDGGKFVDDDAAVRRIETAIAEGAAVLDIGAESTRPGASPVPPSMQIERLGDVIPRAAQRGILVSVDTTSPEVARACDSPRGVHRQHRVARVCGRARSPLCGLPCGTGTDPLSRD